MGGKRKQRELPRPNAERKFESFYLLLHVADSHETCRNKSQLQTEALDIGALSLDKAVRSVGLNVRLSDVVQLRVDQSVVSKAKEVSLN